MRRTESLLLAGVWYRDRVDPEDPGFCLVEMRVPLTWGNTLETVRGRMHGGMGTECVDPKDSRFCLVALRVPRVSVGAES